MQRPTYDSIVCLVSEQAIPNLTPALDPHHRPARVVLVVSDDTMARRAAWLGEVFARHGLAHDIVRLAAPDDFASMSRQFRELAACHPAAALNATGGKKTMTLAAYRAFVDAGRPVFYVERNNRLYWLEPDQLAPGPLATVLSLRDLLTAHGQQIVERRTTADPRIDALAAALMQDASGEQARALTELGFFGEGEEKAIRTKSGLAFSPQHREMLRLLRDKGFVRQRGGEWTCAKEDVPVVTGGWLEQYVWRTVHGLADRLGITDVCHGLKIAATDEPELRNEIDVAFVRENRLHLIECKAIKPGVKNKSLADFIYTLESVRKNGGLAARAALLTWGSRPGRADTARAADNRIRILAGPTLNNLELALRTWATQP